MKYTLEERRKRIEALDRLIEDAANDAFASEGQPFDGATVGRKFGQIYASLYTLGRIVQELLTEDEEENLE